MMKKRKYLPIAAIAAVALVAAACSSSGDDVAMVTPTPEPTPPTVHTVDLPEGHGLSAGTTSVAAGATATTDAGTHITCAGTEDCEFTIAMDPVTGAITATSTGGMVSLTTEAGRRATTIAANKTTLEDAQAALTAVQALYDAGDATKNELKAAEKAVADAMMLAGNEPEPVPEPVPAPVLVADLADHIGAAKMLVAALGDGASDGDIEAAKDAIATATKTLGEVENLSDDAKIAYKLTIATIGESLKIAETTIMTARKAVDDANAKAMAAAGKALKKALGKTPLDNIEDRGNGGLGATGLTINPEEPTGVAEPTLAAVMLKAGDSAGSLGDWQGTHYSKTNAGTKTTDTAVVYGNPGPAASKAFSTKYAMKLAKNTYISVPGKTVNKLVSADKFPTAGTSTFLPTAGSKEVSFPGTYDGATGTYTCTAKVATKGCTAAYGSAGITFNEDGDWTFAPSTGAMTSTPDANYLYFGWWLRTVDGKPTMASAFHGVRGDLNGITADGLTTTPSRLSGSATYAGSAAGKFAINDPLSGGDAGDFTADAILTAKFGTPENNKGDAVGAVEGAGISGTIDNFMANDKSVPWSVSLKLAPWKWEGVEDAFGNPDPIDPKPKVAASYALSGKGTVWSIDGTAAAASGTWSGKMYDEKPGDAGTIPAGDGSDVPTSVTGVFQSEFGSTHTMVGAFGATKQ